MLLFDQMLSMQIIFNLISFCSIAFILIIVVSHFLTKYLRLRNQQIQLNSNSFVVITGACTGLGREMIKQISRKYHPKILVVDYQKQLFQEIHKEISDFGSICQTFFCDLRSNKSVKQFIQYLLTKNQNIDLFISNAGIVIPKKALQMTDEEHIMQMNVNFHSPIKIIKSIINNKLVDKGHIAVVSSMVSLAHGGIDVSSYSASKHALSSYINCLRQQLKDENKTTTISVACPYMIRTGMFKGFQTKLDFVFRTLDPNQVAKKLVRQFLTRKQIAYVYQYEALLFRVVSFLPSEILDEMSIRLNVSDFYQIKRKHE